MNFDIVAVFGILFLIAANFFAVICMSAWLSGWKEPDSAMGFVFGCGFMTMFALGGLIIFLSSLSSLWWLPAFVLPAVMLFKVIPLFISGDDDEEN